MADYLEEAAAELRKLRAANEKDAADRFEQGNVRERRILIADRFARLAAIERGLLPPEMVQGRGAGGVMTTGTSLAFAACEALFTAHPDAVADEGDSGEVMSITIADTAGIIGFSRVRLVRHDTVMGRFYRLYRMDDDLAILTITRNGGPVCDEIAADLAAAVPA
jgi:hypothetical protein